MAVYGNKLFLYEEGDYEIERANLHALSNKGSPPAVIDRHEESIEYFDRVIRIESNHAEVYDAKVGCLRSLGLDDESDDLIARREMDDS